MDKVKVKILREVLHDVSATSEWAEGCFRNKVEEICSEYEVSVKEVIYLLFNICSWWRLVFLELPLTLKIVLCYVVNDPAKPYARKKR